MWHNSLQRVAWTLHLKDKGWQRLIGCLKLQVIFRKRATNYRALLRKITYEDKASCECSLPYVSKALLRNIIYQNKVFCGFSSAYISNVSTSKFWCSVAYIDRVPCCVGHLSQISHELRGCCAENNIKRRYPVSCRHPISNVYTSKLWYSVAKTHKMP